MLVCMFAKQIVWSRWSCQCASAVSPTEYLSCFSRLLIKVYVGIGTRTCDSPPRTRTVPGNVRVRQIGSQCRRAPRCALTSRQDAAAEIAVTGEKRRSIGSQPSGTTFSPVPELGTFYATHLPHCSRDRDRDRRQGPFSGIRYQTFVAQQLQHVKCRY